jgi:hypothetical protein
MKIAQARAKAILAQGEAAAAKPGVHIVDVTPEKGTGLMRLPGK